MRKDVRQNSSQGHHERKKEPNDCPTKFNTWKDISSKQKRATDILTAKLLQPIKNKLSHKYRRNNSLKRGIMRWEKN